MRQGGSYVIVDGKRIPKEEYEKQQQSKSAKKPKEAK